MNADLITARIISDAKAQAERTLSEARAKAEQIQKELDSELNKKRAESESLTQKQVADMRDRMLRMAQLDQKKELLSVKREVIDMAFDDAVRRMYKMPLDSKRGYVMKLIVDSAEGGETIIPGAPDRAVFDQSFMTEVNQALEKAGKSAVSLSNEVRDIDGGFVLSKGGMEINCAYKAVLGQYRASLEAEAARIIFN